MIVPLLPREVGVLAAEQLSNIDYSVATRVSEEVATIVKWSYDNDMWWISPIAVQALEYFDNLGSILINIVVWIILHTA